MPDTAEILPVSASQDIAGAIASIESIILGKSQQVKLAVCCLLANGHCLVEDLPGVGKTTLSQAIARSFGLGFNRIQFTSDLLPADILGVSIFDTDKRQFEFHPGPIFANFILADEINRATPKTQSALLEAMEEKQITVEGSTHELSNPFFVIGTQNPLDQSGTFPLPESQMDRFMMRIELGYPDSSAERALLSGNNPRDALHNMVPAVSSQRLLELQANVADVHCSDALLDYVQALIEATRDPSLFIYGLSPRAGLAIVQASRAWAMMAGRDHVEPADVQAVFVAVANHRLIPNDSHRLSSVDLIENLLEATPIP